MFQPRVEGLAIANTQPHSDNLSHSIGLRGTFVYKTLTRVVTDNTDVCNSFSSDNVYRNFVFAVDKEEKQKNNTQASLRRYVCNSRFVFIMIS